jgi:hypothetical protein
MKSNRKKGQDSYDHLFKKEILVVQFKMNQNVGNFKTNKVGTIASTSLKGACGEFNGFLVRLKNKSYEIWDESTLVLLPHRFGKTRA